MPSCSRPAEDESCNLPKVFLQAGANDALRVLLGLLPQGRVGKSWVEVRVFSGWKCIAETFIRWRWLEFSFWQFGFFKKVAEVKG